MTKWILPVNAKRINIEEHFKTTDIFVWKARKRFEPNDIVYVYLTSPIQEIRYQCRCIIDKVPEDVLAEHKYAKEPEIKRYAMFQLIKYYPEGALPWFELHANGLGQALLPSMVFTKLDNFINSKE